MLSMNFHLKAEKNPNMFFGIAFGRSLLPNMTTVFSVIHIGKFGCFGQITQFRLFPLLLKIYAYPNVNRNVWI